ncbi:MoaD/ThiS family protein [Cellulomonas sp. NPDC057328]|uniref:MoaD/ThiS family protein n=1 Tax=Cellulomonas sp. NPDC057328 TaxID=3346101 RepID=UPI00362DE6F5
MTTTDPGGAPAGARAGAPRTVTVRYFAAAHEAAGVAEERVALPADATVGSCVDALADRHGPRLRDVLAVCALLVDGTLHRGRDEPLGDATVVDVLPPFAGG